MGFPQIKNFFEETNLKKLAICGKIDICTIADESVGFLFFWFPFGFSSRPIVFF